MKNSVVINPRLKKVSYNVISRWKEKHGIQVASQMFHKAMKLGVNIPCTAKVEYGLCGTEFYILYPTRTRGIYNTVKLYT